MTETIVDLLEVVGVDQVEDQVAGARVVAVGIGAQSLTDIGFDTGGKIAAVANARQGVGERSFLEDGVGALQFLIETMMLDENQQGHEEHGGQGRDDAKAFHLKRCIAAEQS